MIRNLTIGQYYPVKSRIHALDPRVKLLGTMLFLVSLFINNSFEGYILIAVFFMMVLYLSKVPFRYMLRGLKGIMFILLFSVLMNIFITEGQVVWSFYGLRITVEGIERAVFYAIRLILLIMGSSIMTYTTTPNLLTDGLEKSLGFLSKLHIPIHDFATMIGIALRFIPILSEETDKIIKAQEARGADFESGGFIKKVKAMVPLLIPLLISAFRRAEELAMALDARCYNGGDNRTKLRPLIYKRADYMAYAIVSIYFGAVIAFRLWQG